MVGTQRIARKIGAAGVGLVIALSWGGCTTMKSIVSPPPPPKIPTPAPPAPVTPTREPAPAAPAKKEPEAAPPPKKEPEAPAPVLAPQVGKDDEEQLRRTASSRIQKAEQLLAQLEGKNLTGEQKERLLTVQTLLGNSREAMAAQDLVKASNLAEKARILAEELSQSVK